MPRAIYNGIVLAESDQCQLVEGNFYFPPDAIKSEYFKPSDTQTTCPWKGTARYYTIEVEGKTFKDEAWYYPDPKSAAQAIKNHVAFYKRNVKIEA